MSQAGYTPIRLYYSTTAAAVPTNTNLADGELAINITDGKLFYKDNLGVVQTLASKSNLTTISFGTTGLTPSTATGGAVTVAGTLVVGNGGTGITSGTSGGIPYFSGTSTIASSAALASNALVVGGGAGVAPSTITTGTGVVTALGVNTGTAGAFVVNGGALGTPSSGTVTNLTGTASININGTVGATTPNTGAFTSITVNSNNISAVNSLGFRNRIINGDMRIDQRNAGAAVTTTGGSFYSVDRWTCYRNNSGWSVQQVADAPTGFINSLKVTTTTANAGSVALTQQYFEGYNVADFMLGTASAITFTLSFWIKSSVTGTFAGNFANGVANRSYVFTYTINSANTWEYKTVTATGDTTGTWATNNTAGLKVLFCLGTGGTSATAGSWQAGDLIRTSTSVGIEGTLNATWQITGVQLEAGSVATPFERRDYGRELMMCQRYYWKSFAASTAPANAVGTSTGEIAFSACTTGAVFVRSNDTRFTVEMRNAPTITFFNPVNANSQAYNSSTANDCSGTTLFGATTGSFKWYCTAPSLTDPGNSIGVHSTASAEL